MSPDLSIIITHHKKENQKYLDLCLQSIWPNIEHLNITTEVLVVSGATEPPLIPNWVNLIYENENSSYAYKVNKGVRATNKESKLLLIAQDDLIFGKNAIGNMIKMMGSYQMILNGLSNCDNQWNFLGKFKVRDLELKRQMSWEEVEGYHEDIMNYEPNLELMYPVHMNCLYASLMYKELFYRIGMLDENYVNGVEDADFCYTAKLHHTPCYITTSAFIFHFSGATTKGLNLEQKANHERFKGKWGFDILAQPPIIR